jgi:DNA-binding beta-propeller fold protein YncE
MRFLALLGAILTAVLTSATAEPNPLALETKIVLGEVRGRIDHLAADSFRQRLFVAELGNRTVGVIDLKERKVIRRIGGLREPQGVGYLAAADTLYVANAGDGSVRLFQGDNFAESGRIDLGDDADNVRVDGDAKEIFVGYGDGALAVLAPSGLKIADIPLKGHPESFRLDPASGRVFANVPDAREIAVVDRKARKQMTSWKLPDAEANFPMAFDKDGKRLVVVTRKPARLFVLDTDGGNVVAELETCGDADDVSYDAKRQRIYVSCGQGVIDVFAQNSTGYARKARIATARGARTSLFLAETDSLYVAVPTSWFAPAALWVFRPAP